MIEKGIKVGICYSIHRYTKPKNKHMKDFDKNKESSYFKYFDVNNLHCWEMSQTLPADGFKWVEDLSEFSKDFIKICKMSTTTYHFLKE